MARYLDKTSFHSDTYIQALDLKYDTDELPERFKVGDVLLCNWTTAKEWRWLPAYVRIETPDGIVVEHESPLRYILKKTFGKADYEKKPATERSKNYQRYMECVVWAREHTYDRIEIGDSPFPYKLVTDADEAQEVVASLILHDRFFSFDYETVDDQIVGLALADDDMAWYIPGQGTRALPAVLPWLRELLMKEKKIAHYSKYECFVTDLHSAGTLKPTDYPAFFDTNVMNWLRHLGLVSDNRLKAMTRKMGRDVLEFKSVFPSGVITDYPLDLQALYAGAGDARNTLDLFYEGRDALIKDGLWDVYDKIERPLTPVLVEMEANQLDIDLYEVERQIVEYMKETTNAKKAMYGYGFRGNIDSPDDIADFFYRVLGLPIFKKTDSGSRGAVDKEVRELLAPLHPAVAYYDTYITSNKLLNTFLIPTALANKKKIAYSIKQTSTRTGRLSCTAASLGDEDNEEEGDGTNMQNWKKSLRSIIIAPLGEEFWAADYKSIEPMIVAVASGDDQMLEDFRTGKDCYISLGTDMGMSEGDAKEKRQWLKTRLLAWLYGEHDDFTKSLTAARPKLVAWRDKVIADCKKNGYAETLYGRRRYLPQIWNLDPASKAAAERQASNVPPQGTCGDIIKLAMPLAHKTLKEMGTLGLRMSVHDELCWTAPYGNDREIVKMISELEKNDFGIPMKVEYAKAANWMLAHT